MEVESNALSEAIRKLRKNVEHGIFTSDDDKIDEALAKLDAVKTEGELEQVKEWLRGLEPSEW